MLTDMPGRLTQHAARGSHQETAMGWAGSEDWWRWGCWLPCWCHHHCRRLSQCHQTPWAGWVARATEPGCCQPLPVPGGEPTRVCLPHPRVPLSQPSGLPQWSRCCKGWCSHCHLWRWQNAYSCHFLFFYFLLFFFFLVGRAKHVKPWSKLATIFFCQVCHVIADTAIVDAV